ncbi:CoA transferase [Caballeronia sp. EK]|nr:CoA transferase [Caballeronia sp. EK]
MVFLESPVCLAISRSGTPSRKCIRRILANMLTVITPFSCLASKQEVEHVGQFSMQISSGNGSVLRAHQHRKGYISDQRGGSVHDSSHFYSTYRCADGNYITVGAIEPQFYEVLLNKLGLSGDARFTDQWNRSRWPALRQHLVEVFASKTRAEWTLLLESTDACFGSVLSPQEAAAHPHNIARGVYFEGDGYLQAAPAPRFDGKSMTAGPVPTCGEHTYQIADALREGGPAHIWK